jgi:hypothetical protein
MAKTDRQLSDEEAKLVRRALLDLRRVHGPSARAVAEYLTGFAGTTISGQSVQRWWSPDGRPGVVAWRALVHAGAIDADAAPLPTKPARGELSPSEVADLKQASQMLSRIAARLR